MKTREPLLWRLRWWRECRRRKAEEFRLYRLQLISGDEDDRRAWDELREENHALGVW